MYIIMTGRSEQWHYIKTGLRRLRIVMNGYRRDSQSVHFLFLSAAAILETSHRIPNLDYDILMKLTLQLTKSMEECEKLYRLMCFNVFAHNRDDHSKNFSYIYRDREKRWILSPAYDLTYSNSIGGEHATTVNGNGVDPGMEDLLSVAKKIGIGMAKAKKRQQRFRNVCMNDCGTIYLIG